MEQWKDIPQYEDIYQASNLGNIRTCEGKVTKNAHYPHRVWKQRILKPKWKKRRNSGKRDACVSLWKDGHEKTWLVARLVALTWCEGCKDGMTVNHIDGDSENNRAENLEWVTHADNIRKGFETGLYRTQKKVEMIDANGVRYSFRSLASASVYLGKNAGYISTMLRKGHETVSGYRIVFES